MPASAQRFLLWPSAGVAPRPRARAASAIAPDCSPSMIPTISSRAGMSSAAGRPIFPATWPCRLPSRRASSSLFSGVSDFFRVRRASLMARSRSPRWMARAVRSGAASATAPIPSSLRTESSNSSSLPKRVATLAFSRISSSPNAFLVSSNCRLSSASGCPNFASRIALVRRTSGSLGRKSRALCACTQAMR